MSGTASVTATWQPAGGDIVKDPAPAYVVTRETIALTPRPSTSVPSQPTTNTGLANQATVRYATQPVTGTTVTVTSPSVSVSATARTSGNGLNCAFAYNASVNSLTVNASGTTPDPGDGKLKVLAGQEIILSLASGSYGLKPGTCNWTITGDVFKDYIANTTKGELIQLAPADYKFNSPSLYARIAGTISASCTATITVPTDGVPTTGLLDISAKSRDMIASKPEVI